MSGDEIEAAIPWAANRAETARDTLGGFVGQACTVDRGSKVYTNMVLDSFETPRDPDTGDAVAFTAAFTHIVTAASEVAPISKAAAAYKKKKGGKRPTTVASEPVKEKVSAAVLLWDNGKKILSGGR